MVSIRRRWQAYLAERSDRIQGQIRQPQNPVNRVIAQKSVFVQPPKGFVEPDAEINIPKDLKKPLLDHLRKYHGISTATIYNDLHGFIKNQGIHQSAYTAFYTALASSDAENRIGQ